MATMPDDFKDKTVLITGAGSGIGAATARLMAARGAAVVATDVDIAAVETVVADCADGLALRCDVTDEAQVEAAVAAAVDRFGKLDVAVANAGIQRHNTDIDLYALELAEFERTQDVNLRGVVRTAKHALAHMMARGGGGALVLVSSITGLGGRTPNVSYMTAKSALLGLNRHIAVHYGPHGIRCNAVCPGALEQTPNWDEHPDPDGRRDGFTATVPLRRLGRPEDIAGAIAFLASDEAGYASGAHFTIDGGLTAI